jgi:hypothetical protein
MYLGHIYQNTSIFEVLSQFKNDMACMRVFSYSIEETTDELGNIVYKDVYELINPNLLDDDDDSFDNYKKNKDGEASLFGTGMKIVLYEDETCTKEVDSIQGIILGDLTGDGKVNDSDGQMLQSFLIPEISPLSLGVFLYAGLVSDKDGEGLYVNNSDGQILQSFLMNEDDSDYNSKYIVDMGE